MTNQIVISTKLSTFDLNVKFNIVKGINCLFGPSGSGKTTIINCIAGIIKPDSAYIDIENIKLNDTKLNIFYPIHRRDIGYVFQESRLFPHLSVKKNLTYGMRFSKSKRFEFKEIIDLLGLKEILNRYTYNLSGGEKQRVAIGRALLRQPKLLLMDEPLASLDQNKKNELLHYISKLDQKLKLPIIYVSHSITEIFSLGKRINFVDKGKVVFSGNINEAISYFNKDEKKYSDASYIKGRVKKIIKLSGLTELEIGKTKLIVFSDDFKKGSNVIVKINSTDIIISKTLPKALSSLNYLKVKIQSIFTEKNLVSLILKFEDNIIKAKITKKSFVKLKLKPGVRCYALVKAVNINDIIKISLI